MAKQDVQDIRVVAIEEIGRTENLRVLRNVSGNLNHMSFNCNFSRTELNAFLNEGITKITKLLGFSASSFKPLQVIKETSPMSYFEKIVDGYKNMETKTTAIQKLDKQRATLSERISKSKDKGRYDKAKEYETQLFALNYPFESIEKVNNVLGDLDKSLEDRSLTIDDYVIQKKVYKKLIDLSNEALKTMNLMQGSENTKLLESMQEEIRHFLCYLFFERTGKISNSPNRFLIDYYGEVSVDFEHVLLLFNYLKTIKYEKINEVEAILYYYALEQFVRDILPFMGKEIPGIYLRESPTDFTSKKFEGYSKGYIPYILLPKGYTGYVFEPKNINQQSFIAGINPNDFSVDTMVKKYKEAQIKMRGKNTGLFFTFLDKHLEDKLLPKLITCKFPLNEMDGEYKDSLLEEFEERCQTFSGSESFEAMTNMYNRVVKPYCLEVMGSYIRTFCDKLPLLKNKGLIYIYYVSPTRIAIAIRDDVTDDMLYEVFDEKFIKTCKKVEKPLLQEIVKGNYL